MSMEVSALNTTRACMALLLAVVCCACDRAGSGSGSESREPAGSGSGPGGSADTVVDNWPKDIALRVEETDLATVFSDGWVHANTAHGWSGGTSALTRVAGSSMSFSFTGTRVRWIGWRESGAGIARVFLDGAQVGEIDLYSDTISVQAPVFTSGELAQGPHTLRIEATGTRNPAATGIAVVVDAFEILTLESTVRPVVTRVEDSNAAVSFTGEWNVDSGCASCSGGTDRYAAGPDALASFEFTGTRVRWLGWRKEAGGIARVYLDGALAAEVDLYSTTISPQVPIFTSDVLANGPHTLLIEAGGANNPAATGSIVSVDAFDVAR